MIFVPLALADEPATVPIPSELWTVAEGEVVWVSSPQPWAAEVPEGVSRECRVRLVVDPTGQVQAVQARECDPRIFQALAPSLQKWKAQPVQVEGEAVWVRVEVPVTLRSAPKTVSWVDVKPKEKAMPKLPAGLRSSGLDEVTCTVRLTIDPEGKVTGVDRLDCHDLAWPEAEKAAFASSFYGVGETVQFKFRYVFRIN